jgi:putative transposase
MDKQQELKRLFHCVFNLNYHLVLVTKYRQKCITAPMLARLHEIIAATTEKWQCQLLEFNGEPDHVHLLLSLNPKVAISTFVNNLKTVSSRLIRRDFGSELAKTYRKPVFWSRTYCVLTCGGAPLSVIKQYIEQQAGIE